MRFPERNIFLVMIVLMGALTLANPRFISYTNVMNLLRSTSILGVMNIGATLVILSGGIDLSVGSVLALSSIIASLTMISGFPVLLSVAIGLGSGAVAGLTMGIFIYEARVPPFIATLAGLSIFSGVAMLLSDARKIIGLPQRFLNLAIGKIVGVPEMVIIWIAVVVVGFVITRHTVFGRNIYAMGSNSEAARLSGVNMRRLTYGVYAFCGFTAAIGGILMTARLAGGDPSAGTGYELNTIAAAVVGGASLYGGVGTIVGTLIGTLLIAIIQNGSDLLGINPFVQNIIIGALILLAVMFDQLQKRV